MYRPLSTRQHQTLTKRCQATFGLALADTLLRAYQQPHRRYHTLSHIDEMLQAFDAQRGAWQRPRAVEWAVWFHDVVYETAENHYPDNEAQSARLMVQLLEASPGESLAQWDKDLARRLVLSTHAHRVLAADFSSAEREDAQRFMDLDLRVLARQWRDVQAFDAAIREEFSQYTDEQFATRRIHALQALAKTSVFQGPQTTVLEPLAQENLRKLIAQWERHGTTKH